MPTTRPCTFCGNEIEPGTGKMLVRRDGSIKYFCSSKCQKNTRLGRVSRGVRWTLTAAALKGKIAAPTGAAVVEAPAEAAEVPKEFTIHLPKGKDIPTAVHDLIDRRFGPELSTSQVEKRFVAFSGDAALKHALALWYSKRHAGKAFTEVALDDYRAFLNTAPAKKLLKDWLDRQAKKEKA